jgi:hypothetical protein
MKFHEIFREMKILKTLKKVNSVFLLYLYSFITDTFSKNFEREVSGLRKRIP